MSGNLKSKNGNQKRTPGKMSPFILAKDAKSSSDRSTPLQDLDVNTSLFSTPISQPPFRKKNKRKNKFNDVSYSSTPVVSPSFGRPAIPFKKKRTESKQNYNDISYVSSILDGGQEESNSSMSVYNMPFGKGVNKKRYPLKKNRQSSIRHSTDKNNIGKENEEKTVGYNQNHADISYESSILGREKEEADSSMSVYNMPFRKGYVEQPCPKESNASLKESYKTVNRNADISYESSILVREKEEADSSMFVYNMPFRKGVSLEQTCPNISRSSSKDTSISSVQRSTEVSIEDSTNHFNEKLFKNKVVKENNTSPNISYASSHNSEHLFQVDPYPNAGESDLALADISHRSSIRGEETQDNISKSVGVTLEQTGLSGSDTSLMETSASFGQHSIDASVEDSTNHFNEKLFNNNMKKSDGTPLNVTYASSQETNVIRRSLRSSARVLKQVQADISHTSSIQGDEEKNGCSTPVNHMVFKNRFSLEKTFSNVSRTSLKDTSGSVGRRSTDVSIEDDTNHLNKRLFKKKIKKGDNTFFNVSYASSHDSRNAIQSSQGSIAEESDPSMADVSRGSSIQGGENGNSSLSVHHMAFKNKADPEKTFPNVSYDSSILVREKGEADYSMFVHNMPFRKVVSLEQTCPNISRSSLIDTSSVGQRSTDVSIKDDTNQLKEKLFRKKIKKGDDTALNVSYDSSQYSRSSRSQGSEQTMTDVSHGSSIEVEKQDNLSSFIHHTPLKNASSLEETCPEISHTSSQESSCVIRRSRRSSAGASSLEETCPEISHTSSQESSCVIRRSRRSSAGLPKNVQPDISHTSSIQGDEEQSNSSLSVQHMAFQNRVSHEKTFPNVSRTSLKDTSGSVGRSTDVSIEKDTNHLNRRLFRNLMRKGDNTFFNVSYASSQGFSEGESKADTSHGSSNQEEEEIITEVDGRGATTSPNKMWENSESLRWKKSNNDSFHNSTATALSFESSLSVNADVTNYFMRQSTGNRTTMAAESIRAPDIQQKESTSEPHAEDIHAKIQSIIARASNKVDYDLFNTLVRKREYPILKSPKKLSKRTTATKRNPRPKLYKPAPWANRRLYDFLSRKLEEEFGLRRMLKSEEVVRILHQTVLKVARSSNYQKKTIDRLKLELATLHIIETTYDFYAFIRNFLPKEFEFKVIPSVQPFTNIIWPPIDSNKKESEPILF